MKAYLHESIGSYIIRVRLETAASLLLYSSESIADIAYRIGYDTPSAFTKAFQKRFGTSPSDYRQNTGSLKLTSFHLSNSKFKNHESETKDQGN